MYNDDRLYDAFAYNRRPSNGPDNLDRNHENTKLGGAMGVYNRRPETGDRRNWEKYSGSTNDYNLNHDHNLNRYSGEKHRNKLVDRYEEEKYNKRYPADRLIVQLDDLCIVIWISVFIIQIQVTEK